MKLLGEDLWLIIGCKYKDLTLHGKLAHLQAMSSSTAKVHKYCTLEKMHQNIGVFI